MPARKTIERAAIERLHNDGLTDRQIATQLGCSEHAVWRIRKELGLTPGRRPLPAERLKHIQAMLADGWSWKEIQRTEGAHHDTMQRYFPGTQWTPEQMNEHRVELRRIRKQAAVNEQARRFGAKV